MTDLEIKELANKLIVLGNVKNIYDFLNNERIPVQSYSNFSKKFRENYYHSYREDLVHAYLPQDSDKILILEKLRNS